jgi:RimJ/RimL family protein N-acetyltransferase
MTTQEQTPKPARIEIEGRDGLALRQLTPEDAQAYFDLIEYDRAHLSQVHGSERDGTADKYKTVEDVRKSIETPENTSKLRFGIWDGDVMVGSNNLTPQDEDNYEVESGSWIGKQYTGQHYAVKARELLVNLAFDRLGYQEIVSRVQIGNTASKKSVEKSGFTYFGEDDGQWVFVLKRSDINRLAP